MCSRSIEKGATLPGDLGPAIVHAQRNANTGTGAYGSPTQIAGVRDTEEAARSGVFFRGSGTAKVATTGTSNTAMPEPVFSNQPFNPMASVSAQPADPTAAQNRQEQKQAFVASG